MLSIIMEKTPQNTLAASDAVGSEDISKIPLGEEVFVKITRPRNPRHHRLAFALLNVVFDAQDRYATLDGMLDAIKVAVGHCDERTTLDGKLFIVPRSISFSAMDQTAFKQFYDKMLKVVLENILPHTHKEDLEQQIYNILGERGPNDVR